MNRTQQIQRWRRLRRANSGPHIGRWTVRLGASLILAMALSLAFVVFGAVASVAGVYAYYAKDLPDASAIETQQSTYSTVRIYDRTGQHLLYESIDPRPYRGDRQYLTLDQIPETVRDATIALEDRDFYTNIGVNFRGIGRAFLSNLRGQAVQGASSITQQLVKRILIDPEEATQQLYSRKIKEAILSVEITRRYPGKAGKDQILEWYLNQNFYGNAAYGVEAAARVYYDKSVNDLTLDEIAVITAIPQFPALNPIQSPADAYRRQRKVLVAMQDAGYLTQEQVDGAKRYFNTSLLNELVQDGYLSQDDLPLVAVGNKAATARALNALVKAEYITQDEADAAKKLPGTLWQYTRESAEQRYEVPPDAPHFALNVLQQLQAKYNTPEQPYYIWQHGLQVYTTLDWNLQIYAECEARSHIAALSVQPSKPCQGGLKPPDPIPVLQQAGQKFDHKVSNASIVAIRPNTGEVLVMVGSLDYFDKNIDGEVNVALAQRQPGSSFKPYTYLTAFESGNFSPSSVVMDVRTVFPGGPEKYTPENYDHQYHGPVSLRTALQRSYNIPAVWLLDKVGIGNVIKTAHKMGINGLNRDLSYYGLSLTLGGGEVTLLDHTYAYSTFANGGVMAGQPVPDDQQRPGYRQVDPVFILEVRDQDGNTIDRYQQPTLDRVAPAAPVYILNNVLSDPTPRPAAFGSYAQYLTLADRPVAAKTGTTNDWKDDWTLGYTPDLAVGVWTGNSDSKPMSESSGSLGAAPIWHAIMQKAMEGVQPRGWDQPPGIQKATVCASSGLLPTDACKQTTSDLFLSGHVPTQKDNSYITVNIDKNNGKLANSCTPPDAVEQKTFQVFPANAADWVREQKIEQPPTEQDGPCAASVSPGGSSQANGDAAISAPAMGSYVHGQVNITGNAHTDGFRSYKLEVASLADPNTWTPIGGEHGDQVFDAHLETWDTTGFDGPYTLRLTVMKNDGGVVTSETQVTVDSKPPTVSISQPAEKSTYSRKDDEWISIGAETRDDWAIARVEFYLDDQKIGESMVAPYGIKWNITLGGQHKLMAKAFDRAGNEADSAPVTIILQP